MTSETEIQGSSPGFRCPPGLGEVGWAQRAELQGSKTWHCPGLGTFGLQLSRNRIPKHALVLPTYLLVPVGSRTQDGLGPSP